MWSAARFTVCLTAILTVAVPAIAADSPHPPNGHATIHGNAGSSEIVITTTDRVAGAIHSLTWSGKEFVDSRDHGRQFQSAASFDCGRPGEFWAERFNPTEAGSRADGAGQKSTSKLLSIRADGPELNTRSQMAFWLGPGEKSEGRPALNNERLSNHIVSKRVHIGHGDLLNVIEYNVTFTVPRGEHHTFAQFEALTGYMPAEFSRFRVFQPNSGTLAALDDGPGEQELPIVFATENGFYSLGVYSPDEPSPGFAKQGYGRFRFAAEKVVKWNIVFRKRDEGGIAAGDYRFHIFLAVGTLDDVRQSLAALLKGFRAR